MSKVREAGYDGLVGYDEGVKYIAVMSPGQLKDAYENTGAFSTSNDDIRFRQVYHGSPASFGHFDHAFTGTGEGAQAYGWGDIRDGSGRNRPQICGHRYKAGKTHHL